METPPPNVPLDYATTNAPAPATPDSHPRRRSLESLAGLLLVLGALPAGLVVNVVFNKTGQYEPGKSNAAGFAVVLGMAALGTLLAWHSRQRIRRSGGELYGMTSATVALMGGLCMLAACSVVMLKTIFPTR